MWFARSDPSLAINHADLRGKTNHSGVTSAIAQDPEVAEEHTLDFMLLSKVTEADMTARRVKRLPALNPLQ